MIAVDEQRPGLSRRRWASAGLPSRFRATIVRRYVTVIPIERVAVPRLLMMGSRRIGRMTPVGDAGLPPLPSRLAASSEDPEHDRALMRLIVAGREDAFAAIYDRYAAQVNGVALSILHSPALAEEATHDVFLRLWQQPAAFDPARGTFAGWLLRVARNRAIDIVRRRREEPVNGREEDVSSWIVDPAPGPEEETLDRLNQQLVREALSELAPDHRYLLELAYFTGLSHSQIAAYLGRPLGTVKSQIRVAMGNLADRLVASRETVSEGEGRR